MSFWFIFKNKLSLFGKLTYLDVGHLFLRQSSYTTLKISEVTLCGLPGISRMVGRVTLPLQLSAEFLKIKGYKINCWCWCSICMHPCVFFTSFGQLFLLKLDIMYFFNQKWFCSYSNLMSYIAFMATLF